MSDNQGCSADLEADLDSADRPLDRNPMTEALDATLPDAADARTNERDQCRALPPISAYLFTERPLLERFGAAAAAGFTAVELQSPYDHAPAAVKAELDRHGLTQLGINTAVGGREGDSGLGAVPGRERDWDAVFGRRSIMPWRSAAARSTAWPAWCRRSSGRRPRRTFIANLDARRRPGAGQQHHAADRADQPARPAGLFPDPRRARRRHHRQGRPAEREDPVRFLSRADRGRRPHQALREAPAADRPCADRGGAVARRAGRGRGQLSGDVRGARPARLGGLGRLRIQAPRPHRGRARLGAALRHRPRSS